MHERKQTGTPWTQRTRRRRELRKGPLLAILIVLVVGIVGGVWHWKRSLIYHPLTTLNATPALVELPFDRVEIGSPAASAMVGWYLPAAPEDAAEAGRKVVLYLHGFDGNMAEGLHGEEGKGIRLQKMQMFHQLGLDVMAFDYRGYGRSPGWPTEEGLYQDGFAAYFYLTDKRHIPSTNIFLFGEGLGAAVALEIASRGKGAGVITEGAPASVDHWLTERFPGIPWGRIPLDKFDSLNRVGRIQMPLMIIHSEDDEQVSHAHAEELIKRAREPKQLVNVYGSHGKAFVTSFDTYHDAICKFVGVDVPKETQAQEQVKNPKEEVSEGLNMRLSAPEPPGAP
jgi:fermentation-respiration switch protein FrsA (DUF1100 family)